MIGLKTNSIGLEYKLIRSKRKTLALEIHESGQLIVRAPMRASQSAIHQLISKHQSWIEKKQAAVAIRQTQKPLGYYFLGHCYALIISEKYREPLKLDQQLHLHPDYQLHENTVLEHWYKRQAESLIPERVHAIANQHDFSYSKIKITNAKTYWGLCNKDNVLSFNWHIIKGPLETIDYLIVHELVHTQIKNHSKFFWAKVKSICSDYKIHEQRLKNWVYGR